MRGSVLFVVFALPFTVASQSAIGQEANEPQQKQLIAFVANGWANMVSAQSIEQGAEHPTVVYLKGSELHEDTGQIEAHGNVSVVPVRHETGSRPAVLSPR